ncbi:neuronal acetylcholine receptor subunit alpha-7-like isoform X1 [Carcharodon carcharias]|uniref:neuronal acetylcholine receptor subunit alpha-7-like isoform X1 n=2 Tax=Carcharodon carcharias TaxID=13397 RepID=UPI001B7F404F|nr:neuronal acetylcholine receptor subunit alpha-7-like isoform X1 [Carcharodon carcharias]
MNWQDHYLQWNESEYPGVKNIRFRSDQIWIPDILLYNSADGDFDSTFKTNVLVNSSGHCTFIPPGIFMSFCSIDVRWFPFDIQKCKLKFGSWTYDGWLLDLQMLDADLSGFIPNGEWDLIGVPGQRNEIYYEYCKAPYPDITFHIMIRRRTLYYALNLLIPCMLLSCMALLVFLLPAESGEKISLGITVLLCLTVFMLLVAEIMPATSDSIPLIGQYFASIMVIVGFVVIATVFVLQYHHHNPTEGTLPKWVRTVLLQWCAWFLRMKKPGAEAPRPPCKLGPRRQSSESGRSSPVQQAPIGNLVYLGFRGLEGVQSPRPGYQKPPVGLGPGSYLSVPDRRLLPPRWVPQGDPQLGRILEEVEYLANRLRSQDEEEGVCSDWRFAAAVLDRMCLMAFAVFNIICTISILMSAPNFVEAVSKDYL